ncbi:MAG: hypothetical protein E7578_03855 [Ruminococcaceae bacterium]|nr:hypothetical protein [Oscillospiraceae bacterium]
MRGFILSGIPELFLLSLAFMLGDGGTFISIFAAALIHELGHIIAAFILGIKMRFYKVGIAGLSLRYDFSGTSHISEAVVCLSGPALGILVFLFGYARGTVSYFIGASAGLSLFNLLPISYLDGGCALSALLSVFLSPDTVWRICRVLSIVFTVLLWVGAVFMIIRSYGDISVLAVSVYLLYRLFSEA